MKKPFNMGNHDLYDESTLDKMLSHLQEANQTSKISISPQTLHASLHDLWNPLGWLNPIWQEFEAQDNKLSPTAHRDLSHRYARLAQAQNLLEPSLIDDAMRKEIHRLARQRSAHLRHYAHQTLRQGKRVEDPPLLDRMAEDQELLRRIAADLAQIHGSQGPARGRARETDLDDALALLANLFIDLAGFDGDLMELDRTARQPFLHFADSALAPFNRIARHGWKNEALTKRWRRLLSEISKQ